MPKGLASRALLFAGVEVELDGAGELGRDLLLFGERKDAQPDRALGLSFCVAVGGVLSMSVDRGLLFETSETPVTLFNTSKVRLNASVKFSENTRSSFMFWAPRGSIFERKLGERSSSNCYYPIGKLRPSAFLMSTLVYGLP